MGIWNSRGLRGSTLEDMINHTNDLYREKKLALIQKIPTRSRPSRSIKPAAISRWRISIRRVPSITSARFRAFPVCFDAKECAADTFPLQNVHPHQVAFMRELKSRAGLLLNYIFFTEG